MKQPRIMQMIKAVPVHDPHLSCKFLDHDDKYYEGEAGQCLHLQLHTITIKKKKKKNHQEKQRKTTGINSSTQKDWPCRHKFGSCNFSNVLNH